MSTLKERMKELWWLYTLQAIVTLLFGIMAVFLPGLTLVTLLYLFTAYLLVFGILDAIGGLASMKHDKTWWVNLLLGVAYIGVAVYLIKNPDIAASAFVAFIGALLILRGVFEVIMAFLFDRNERMLDIIGGLLAVAAGVIIWVYPLAGSLAFVWVLGLFAIVRGILMLGLVAAPTAELKKK